MESIRRNYKAFGFLEEVLEIFIGSCKATEEGKVVLLKMQWRRRYQAQRKKPMPFLA